MKFASNYHVIRYSSSLCVFLKKVHFTSTTLNRKLNLQHVFWAPDIDLPLFFSVKMSLKNKSTMKLLLECGNCLLKIV